jgi:sterol desaturase/sphingolipid hydroxylase (fatty acid hydroxylase superfamily)
VDDIPARSPGLLLVVAAIVLVEIIWAIFIAKRSYDFRASAASVGIVIGLGVFKPLTAGLIIGIFTWVHSYAPLVLPIDDWRSWVVGFFAVEFFFYWFHRFSHNINWFWATHAVHHSANEMNLTAGLRLGWTGGLTGGWLVYAQLALLGMPVLMMALLIGLAQFYQLWLHTEAVRNLGPLEWILVTPSHHRAHHSSDGPWLDCNFGGTLIIFDRLFGTFVPEPEEGGLKYGLTEPIRSNNPFVIAFRTWAVMGTAFVQATDWRRKLKVLCGKPKILEGQ